MSEKSFEPHLRPAVLVAYAGAILYVVLLGVLHAVQPHMLDDATISKYALGRGGWMLQAAFVAAGLAYSGVAQLVAGRTRVMAWLTALAFVVMGSFRIDAAGPDQIVSFHGAMHTAAFVVVVLLAHALMFAFRRHARSSALRVLPFIAPLLAVVGFALPGIVGALVFRAWTLTLVAWVVLVARQAAAATGLRNDVPSTPIPA
jgi:hypothetical protein